MLFALSSEHSVAQGLALSVRLLLQLGYNLPLGRSSSKALVLVAALSMKLIFEYYSADLTATMTSKPRGFSWDKAMLHFIWYCRE